MFLTSFEAQDLGKQVEVPTSCPPNGHPHLITVNMLLMEMSNVKEIPRRNFSQRLAPKKKKNVEPDTGFVPNIRRGNQGACLPTQPAPRIWRLDVDGPQRCISQTSSAMGTKVPICWQVHRALQAKHETTCGRADPREPTDLPAGSAPRSGPA